VRRRNFMRLLGLAGAACGVMGHSPYRQWQAYRKSRLIIVASAADAVSYRVGESVAALLARELPESRATVARAADAVEIVKLLVSDQLEVGVLSAADAHDAVAGRGRFTQAGPVALRTLAALGDYRLVARGDFPDARAESIARALAEHGAPAEAFEAVAARVVDAFTAETGGVRNVRIDIRRRDTAPESDATIVGVLGMDIRRKDDPAWYSIRLLFGQRQGRWSFLKAYHELPGQGPVWTEAGGWYRTVAEHAIAR
jgi:NMT1 family protein